MRLGSNSTAFLLVGHGTRCQAGQQQFLQLHQLFADRLGDYASRACFLELAQPSISDAMAELAQSKVSRLVVVPALLFEAGHAASDIPGEVRATAKAHGIEVVGQSRPLECRPELLSASLARFSETLKANIPTHDSSPARDMASFVSEEVAVLFVGRGSSSASATTEMLRFAEMRFQAMPPKWAQTCFLHGQKPDLETAVVAARQQKASQVVVQPHLLFEGQLTQRLKRTVQQQNAIAQSQRWVIADPLGASNSVADALVQAARDVLLTKR